MSPPNEGTKLTADIFMGLFAGKQIFQTKPDRADIPCPEGMDSKLWNTPWHHSASDLQDVYPKLKRFEDQGRSVFFTVNELDQSKDEGRKRTKKMYVRTRAVWCEDDSSKTYRTDWPIQPNMVIWSSGDRDKPKMHYYWLTDTGSQEETEGVLQTLVDKWGGDNQAKDVTRVLRVPGFYHQKNGPKSFMVNGVLFRSQRYSWPEIKKAFPSSTIQNTSSGTKSANGFDLKQLEVDLAAGTHIHGPCSSLSMHFASQGKSHAQIDGLLRPKLEASEASRADHAKHNDWNSAVNGGLRNDIETAVKKVQFEKEKAAKHEVSMVDRSISSFIGARDLLELEIPPINFVIEKILPEGVTLFSGKPKKGKSWLVYLVAVAIASGIDVFGSKTNKGAVLYLSLEDSNRRLKNRLKTILSKLDISHENLRDRLIVATEAPRIGEGLDQVLKNWYDSVEFTRGEFFSGRSHSAGIAGRQIAADFAPLAASTGLPTGFIFRTYSVALLGQKRCRHRDYADAKCPIEQRKFGSQYSLF